MGMGVLKNLVIWCQDHRAPRLLIALMKTVINLLPLVGVVTIFVWSYQLYVLQFGFDFLLKRAQRPLMHSLVLLGVYHVLGLLTMSSYFRCVFTSPKISAEDRRRLNLDKQDERYCESCLDHKPRRTHHCFWCETCVLKMDHHCPWLGNCVGHNNYKYFVLMLIWTWTFCLYVAFSLRAHPDFRHPGKAGIQSLGYALGLGVSTLLFFHLYLVCVNRTTMECGMRIAECSDRDGRPHKYDLGLVGNLSAVLGQNKLLWLIPVKPEWSDPRNLRDGFGRSGDDDELDTHPVMERLLDV